ncbi:MAG: flagellar motor switch protein FliN [Myxococcota bacterium]
MSDSLAPAVSKPPAPVVSQPPVSSPPVSAPPVSAPPVSAPPVSAPPTSSATPEPDHNNINMPADDGLERVLSISLTVHVELGRRRVRVGELLKMGVGQVVELDAAAGAPLSIFANNTLIAEGEAVVVGDRYGIRITDIVSPQERVQRLGGKGGAG